MAKGRIFGFFSFLFFFAIQVAYNLFVIWGLVRWDDAHWITSKTTAILIAVPTLLVFNIILGIIVMIASASAGKKKEEEKKKFPFADKIGKAFKDEKKEEKDLENKIGNWFKENFKDEKAFEEKIGKWFKENVNKDIAIDVKSDE
ncbi:MAG: hypothetical protein ACTSR1_05450 [Candidatus Heimdallarchaeota archaeon]